MNKCICVIPARGGSTRIPKKNIRDFHGKPIIAYSIEAASQSKFFDQVIVSTDSEEIGNIARSYGAEIHIRSDEMSRNEVGTQEVMKTVLEYIGIKQGIACCIYATSPLMSVEDLKIGYRYLIYNKHRYALSVGTNPLLDAAQFYWGGVNSFLDGISLYGIDTSMVPIAAERVCDINTEEDWKRAEAMYEALQNG